MDPETQDEPIQEQNLTTDGDRIAGIVEQSRADFAGRPVADVAALLRQRFDQAGLQVSDAEVERLAAEAAR